jgi:hypothetical protein
MIDKLDWLKNSSEHYTTLWKNSKSLAQGKVASNEISWLTIMI